MRPFGVPEVFLLVAAENAAVVGNEVCDVVEFGAVCFDDGARHDADAEFFRERLVGGKIRLRERAGLEEQRGRGKPVGEMVFRKDC